MKRWYNSLVHFESFRDFMVLASIILQCGGCDRMLGAANDVLLTPCSPNEWRCDKNRRQTCIDYEWRDDEPCPLTQPVCTGKGECSVVRSVSAGGHHACALVDLDGSIRCWGGNESGQLGNGFTLPVSGTVTVPNLSNVARIRAGGHDDAGFTCALDAMGQIWCWGDNTSGQLGTGDKQPIYSPNLIQGVSGVKDLALGQRHACGIWPDGNVRCWGWDTIVASNTPTEVSGISNATSIDAGGRHTCAIVKNGDVYCWGYNGDGQCGQSLDTEFLIEAKKVEGISNATMIAAGYFHTCAVSKDQIYCWGRNDCGQLGRGTYCGDYCPRDKTMKACGEFTPAPVNLNPQVFIGLDLGSQHSCVLNAGGDVACWGQANYGQAGSNNVPVVGGGAIFFTTPSKTGQQHATMISLGAYFSCAVTDARDVHCWGRNEFGQLGFADSVQW